MGRVDADRHVRPPRVLEDDFPLPQLVRAGREDSRAPLLIHQSVRPGFHPGVPVVERHQFGEPVAGDTGQALRPLPGEPVGLRRRPLELLLGGPGDEQELRRAVVRRAIAGLPHPATFQYALPPAGSRRVQVSARVLTPGPSLGPSNLREPLAVPPKACTEPRHYVKFRAPGRRTTRSEQHQDHPNTPSWATIPTD